MGLFRGRFENDSADLLSVSVCPRNSPIGIFRRSTENDSTSVLSFSRLLWKCPVKNIQGTMANSLISCSCKHQTFCTILSFGKLSFLIVYSSENKEMVFRFKVQLFLLISKQNWRACFSFNSSFHHQTRRKSKDMSLCLALSQSQAILGLLRWKTT